MGATFFVHKLPSCGGNVVIDVSRAAKLVAPSFMVGEAGVSHLTMDILTFSAEGKWIASNNEIKIQPVWECTGCGETISTDNLGEELYAMCQICNKEKPAKELFIHSRVACVCSECKDDIRTFKEGNTVSDLISSYMEMFDLGPRSRFTSLLTILTKEFSL